MKGFNLEDLNQEQQEAVRWFNGPAVVLAGAGSGKTRCLTYRVAYLIKERNVKPEEIVLLTFTNKAANEMRQRVYQLLGYQVKLGFVGTFHSFAAWLLRRFAPWQGRSKGYLIFDNQDSKSLIQTLIKKLKLTQLKPTEALYYLGLIKRQFLGETAYLKDNNPKKEAINQLYEAYQEELRKNNAFDFNDLLLESYFLLSRKKETLQQVASEYSYFLVDEYQDTNNIQYQLLHLLTKEKKNVFVVGDFSQSIYSFRGADYRNINRFLKNYPQAKIFKLPLNYRSYPEILQAASEVIKNNTTHPTLNLLPTRQGRGKIILLPAVDAPHEALVVIRRVIELFSDGVDLDKMAVLYRTHNQARLFEEVLIKAKLPYHIVGGWRFFERKEIKDLLSYLRLFYNPNDEVAYKRSLRLGKRRLTAFLNWLSSVDRNQETAALLEEIIKVTNYRQLYSPLVPEDKARLDNIDELLNFASEHPRIEDFFQQASLLGASDEVINHRHQTQKGKLNLMTVHAAKGLEFDVVFLTGLEEGIFPHSLTQNLEQLEEERRLFYVALTRAKKELYLSYAGRRMYRGSYRNQFVSRFVNEIPNELIEVEEI